MSFVKCDVCKYFHYGKEKGKSSQKITVNLKIGGTTINRVNTEFCRLSHPHTFNCRLYSNGSWSCLFTPALSSFIQSCISVFLSDRCSWMTCCQLEFIMAKNKFLIFLCLCFHKELWKANKLDVNLEHLCLHLEQVTALFSITDPI